MKAWWLGHTAHIRGLRNAYKILIGKPERKKPMRNHGI